ncbi:MAG: DUF6922 domain-containing protein [Acidimicrobiales bacterium]
MILPTSIQRLFYRYHAKRLDTATHKLLIIQAVLEDGSVSDWSWLFATYGWDTVRDWVADPVRAAQLSPAVEWFWTGVLLGKPHETPRWNNGNHRRLVPVDALPDWWPSELR